MKKFMTFSSAMLKNFEQCEKLFEYKYVQGISLPSDNSNFIQGKNIHALANYYLKNFNIEKLENMLNCEEMKLWQTLRVNKYFNMETINSEYSLTAKIGKNWVNGRFDALVKKDNDYFIIDYKTGSIPKNPEEDYQTIIYLLIADKFIKDYDSLTFVYLDLKNNKNIKIELNEGNKKTYKNKLTNIIENIKKNIATSAYKKSSTKCRCEFEKLCKIHC